MVHPLLVQHLSCVNKQRSCIMVVSGIYNHVHAFYGAHVCHWHRVTVKGAEKVLVSLLFDSTLACIITCFCHLPYMVD